MIPQFYPGIKTTLHRESMSMWRLNLITTNSKTTKLNGDSPKTRLLITLRFYLRLVVKN